MILVIALGTANCTKPDVESITRIPFASGGNGDRGGNGGGDGDGAQTEDPEQKESESEDIQNSESVWMAERNPQNFPVFQNQSALLEYTEASSGQDTNYDLVDEDPSMNACGLTYHENAQFPLLKLSLNDKSTSIQVEAPLNNQQVALFENIPFQDSNDKFIPFTTKIDVLEIRISNIKDYSSKQALGSCTLTVSPIKFILELNNYRFLNNGFAYKITCEELELETTGTNEITLLEDFTLTFRSTYSVTNYGRRK